MATPELHAIYHLALGWSEAATLVSRLLNSAPALDSLDRARLQAAADACIEVRRELGSVPERPMGRVLLRVCQPVYSKQALLEALESAERGLSELARATPGSERVTLGSGRLAWLFEFLSDCCNLLLRDIATQSLPQAVSKGA